MAVNLMIKSGLHNHAKAVSYSAVPLMLLFVYFLNTYLAGYPEIREAFNSLILFTHLNFLEVESGTRPVFEIPSWLSIGMILWTSRGVYNSIRNAFTTIFSEARKSRVAPILPVLIFPFGFLVISFVMLGDYAMDHIDYSSLGHFGYLAKYLLGSIASVLLAFSIWGTAFLIYYRTPAKSPPARSAALCSLFFIVSTAVFLMLFRSVMNLEFYSRLYGMVGELIYVLIWVYLGSLLFFFWAQFLHVSGRIDLFALEKIFLESASLSRPESAIEHFLFRHSERIFGKYGQHFRKGDVIFRQNEHSQTVYFIYSGKVVFRQHHDGQDVPIGILHEGEIFGEMAHLLGESRIATAIADSDCFLFVLTPEMYVDMMHGSLPFSAKIIESLCQRISRMSDAAHPVDRTSQIESLDAKLAGN